MGAAIEVGNYQGTSCQTRTELEAAESRLRITGMWAFSAVPSAPLSSARHHLQFQAKYTQKLKELGYKIGVKVRRDQTIVEFSFEGVGGSRVRLRADAGVTRELEQAFPPHPGEQWHGLVPEGGDRLATFFDSVVVYPFVLVLGGPVHTPQAVPIVLTHGTARFSEHYMLDVRVVTDDVNVVSTNVMAIK